MILKEGSLNGVVLAGGKSVRMGQDKGAINWHGTEQRYYVAEMLKSLCTRVFISCREDQQMTNEIYPLLIDTVTGIGPYGAILSAFEKQPDTAWLVVACDLPLLDLPTLQYLVDNRNKKAIATAFTSPYDGLPEPLITIWEPAAYPYLKTLLAEGYKCPRKALINSSQVHLLEAPRPEALMNANTPEDAEKVKLALHKK